MAGLGEPGRPGFVFGLEDVEIDNSDESTKDGKGKAKNKRSDSAGDNSLTGNSQNNKQGGKGIIYMILYVTGFVCGRITTHYLLDNSKKKRKD